MSDREEGSVVLEGAWLVERALSAGLRLKEILCVASRREWAETLVSGAHGNSVPTRSAIQVMSEAEIAHIAGYPFHRGVLGFAERTRDIHILEILREVDAGDNSYTSNTGSLSGASERDAGRSPSRRSDMPVGRTVILILPETLDPENLGASFRNAAAFGCRAVVIGPRCPDPLSRRVLRVSMGASMSLPWARMDGSEALAELRAAGFSLAACVLDPAAEDVRTWDPPRRLAVVLGNEASGLSPQWLAACTHRITIPMSSLVDSLNVATAGAVILYAVSDGNSPQDRSVRGIPKKEI